MYNIGNKVYYSLKIFDIIICMYDVRKWNLIFIVRFGCKL